VGYVDVVLRAGERFEVAPAQAPAATETGQLNAERSIDSRVRLSAKHVPEPLALRPVDLERNVGPAKPCTLGQILVANVDATDEGYFIVNQEHLAVITSKPTHEQRA
jgi:hypothetical protein